ncbi:MULTISPECIES: YrdB family protein [Barrientosiimonas]|nr:MULTISPECIES: YrdB family protein [Barrientosiimonas]
MVRPGEAVMFLLELAAYVGVALWAYSLADSTLVGVLLALGAIAVMGTIWALFSSPHARYPVYGWPRVALEVAWFGIAVAAFIAAGILWAGVLLAVVFLALLVYRLRAVGS